MIHFLVLTATIACLLGAAQLASFMLLGRLFRMGYATSSAERDTALQALVFVTAPVAWLVLLMVLGAITARDAMEDA